MKQTTRSLMQLGVMVLVAGALGLFAWKGVYQPDAKKAEQKAHEERVFDADPGAPADAGVAKLEFNRLLITAHGETTELERAAPGPWKIVRPVSAPADALVVGGIESQLKTAKFKASLEPAPDEATLKSWGLAPPEFTVEAHATLENGQERTLLLEGGVENPFDGSCYVRRDHQPTVFTVPGGLRWAVLRTTFELRDKKVFAVEEPKLLKVSLKTKHADWALERDAEKRWAFTRPFTALADPALVAAWLGPLSFEAVTAFVDDSPARRKEFGLGAPEVPLELLTADGQKRTYQFSGRHGLREDPTGAQLVEVSQALVTALEKPAQELKDKSVLSFKKEDVTKVVLPAADGRELVLVREGASAEKWRLESPVQGPAKAFKVNQVLWLLANLKAVSFGAENPKDWSRYGLGPKARTATVYDAAGKVLEQLTLGDALKDKPEQRAVRGLRPQVMELEAARLVPLPTRAEDLLDLPADAGP
jgi:hypothetical protein